MINVKIFSSLGGFSATKTTVRTTREAHAFIEQWSCLPDVSVALVNELNETYAIKIDGQWIYPALDRDE